MRSCTCPGVELYPPPVKPKTPFSCWTCQCGIKCLFGSGWGLSVFLACGSGSRNDILTVKKVKKKKKNYFLKKIFLQQCKSMPKSLDLLV